MHQYDKQHLHIIRTTDELCWVNLLIIVLLIKGRSHGVCKHICTPRTAAAVLFPVQFPDGHERRTLQSGTWQVIICPDGKRGHLDNCNSKLWDDGVKASNTSALFAMPVVALLPVLCVGLAARSTTQQRACWTHSQHR